ncbi:unnamed protein product, partial [Iphiclides podalirius]
MTLASGSIEWDRSRRATIHTPRASGNPAEGVEASTGPLMLAAQRRGGSLSASFDARTPPALWTINRRDCRTTSPALRSLLGLSITQSHIKL